MLTSEFNLNLRSYDACSTKPTVLDCTYSVLSLSRIKKKEANKTKAKNQTKKRHSCVIFLPQFSNIWGQHIKTGFHKSQGTEIRRTDWSTPILIQLINAQPENNRGCPWHPLKKVDLKRLTWTVSDYLCSKLKLWSGEAPLCAVFEELRLLWSSYSTFVSSLQLPTSEKCYKRKKKAQSFLRQTVNMLLMDEKSRSKSVEEFCCN